MPIRTPPRARGCWLGWAWWHCLGGILCAPCLLGRACWPRSAREVSLAEGGRAEFYVDCRTSPIWRGSIRGSRHKCILGYVDRCCRYPQILPQRPASLSRSHEPLGRVDRQSLRRQARGCRGRHCCSPTSTATASRGIDERDEMMWALAAEPARA